MKLENTKVGLAGWLLAIGAVGLAADVTSVWGWTALAGLALLPPVFMLRVWNDAPQSMTESIREARR
jgi:hypothetical protein